MGYPLRRAKRGVRTDADTKDGSVRTGMAVNISESMAYHRLLIEVCPVGVIVYKATGECITANNMAAKIIGGTVAELQIQNFYELKSWKEFRIIASCKTMSRSTNNSRRGHSYNV